MYKDRGKPGIARTSILVFLAGAAGWILAFVMEDLVYSILVFSCFVLVVVLVENREKNFLNPIIAFTLFYYPYSLWYSLFRLASGDLSAPEEAIISLTVIYAYFGLLVFYLFYLIFHSFSRQENLVYINIDFAMKPSSLSERLILLSTIGVMLILVAELLTGGYGSKKDVVESGSLIKIVADAAIYLTSVVVLLRVKRTMGKGASVYIYLISIVSLLLLVYLLTGERDYLFRILICFLFIYFDYYRTATFPVILAILFAVVFLMPVTQELKGFLLPGRSGDLEYALVLVFHGEFISASRNLYYLMFYGTDSSYMFLLTDLLRGLIPFSGMLGLESTASWFNSTYKVLHGFGGQSGLGFGLVAQGYLVGGYLGVFVLMAFTSAILVYFYNKRHNSDYWYIFYLLAISTAIYCIRADFANLMSQTFKIGGLAVLTVYLLHVLAKKRGRI